jgi:hypothetical protein
VATGAVAEDDAAAAEGGDGPCVYLPWTQWGSCSERCGPDGTQVRSRTLVKFAEGQAWWNIDCQSPQEMAMQPCNRRECTATDAIQAGEGTLMALSCEDRRIS